MNTMSTPKIATAALALCLVFPGLAAAQDTAGAGTVSGTVVAAAGMPESAVTVCLLGTMRCAITDERGRFRLAEIRAGVYEVELTPPGGSRLSSGKIEVRAGLE